MNQTPSKKKIRKEFWDYGLKGIYFVTMRVQGENPVFGTIKNGRMVLTELGKIVERCWLEGPEHFPDLKLDEFAILPNHFHAVLFITRHHAHPLVDLSHPIREVRQGNIGKHSLSAIIGSFKSAVSRRGRLVEPDFRWRSRFFDHVAKDWEMLDVIRRYIRSSVVRWEFQEMQSERFGVADPAFGGGNEVSCGAIYPNHASLRYLCENFSESHEQARQGIGGNERRDRQFGHCGHAA